jgi:hypothetical protein
MEGRDALTGCSSSRPSMQPHVKHACTPSDTSPYTDWDPKQNVAGLLYRTACQKVLQAHCPRALT